MNPIVGYIENNSQKKRSIGTSLWAVKPVRQSVMLDPWGIYAAGMKGKQNELRGGRPVGFKARTVDYEGPLGADTIKQGEKGSSGNDRWAGEPERSR